MKCGQGSKTAIPSKKKRRQCVLPHAGSSVMTAWPEHVETEGSRETPAKVCFRTHAWGQYQGAGVGASTAAGNNRGTSDGPACQQASKCQYEKWEIPSLRSHRARTEGAASEMSLSARSRNSIERDEKCYFRHSMNKANICKTQRMFEQRGLV